MKSNPKNAIRAPATPQLRLYSLNRSGAIRATFGHGQSGDFRPPNLIFLSSLRADRANIIGANNMSCGA
jgi:hypothetical protein